MSYSYTGKFRASFRVNIPNDEAKLIELLEEYKNSEDPAEVQERIVKFFNKEIRKKTSVMFKRSKALLEECDAKIEQMEMDIIHLDSISTYDNDALASPETKSMFERIDLMIDRKTKRKES